GRLGRPVAPMAWRGARAGRPVQAVALSTGRRKEESMYAGIFEVEPAPGRRHEYLDIAAQLRPELEKIDGFISVERFHSLTQEGKILSLSFWRVEERGGRGG